MKLFLTSGDYSGHAGLFRGLVGRDQPRMLMVSNAKDHHPAEGRAQRVEAALEQLRAFGVVPTELDLRGYFGRSTALRSVVEGYDGLWMIGGNPFNLRRALRESGLDEGVAQMVREGRIIHAGESAGAIMAGSTLRGFEEMDDADNIPVGYEGQTVWDGLGFMQACVIPHYKSSNKAFEAAAAKVEAKCQAEGVAVRPIPDGQVFALSL